MGSFSLDDNSDPTLPSEQTFAGLSPGTYGVVENLAAGFTLSSIVCDDPDSGSVVDLNLRSASIDLDAGETVRCTFTNTEDAPPPDVIINEVDADQASTDSCRIRRAVRWWRGQY